MGLITSLINIAKSAWAFLAGLPADVGKAVQGIWSFARAVQQLTDYVLSHPLTELLNAIALWASIVTGNHEAEINAIVRIDPWIYRHRVLPLRAQVLLWFAQLRARIAYLFAQAYLYINLKFRQAEAYTRLLVGAEHKDMLAHFTAAERYAFAQALTRKQEIEQEAAAAYNAHLGHRLGLAGKLAGIIASHNPAEAALLRTITTGIADLAGAENPLARLALGFLLRELVNRLAVDKVAAQLLDDLLGPVIGTPRSHGVADTVNGLGARIEALESQWATFMDHGGPEVEQAGSDWKELDGLLTDSALLAFMAATIASPVAAANDTARVIIPVSSAAAAAWHRLLT
jgi:hypothetical protein